jgi:hypothetical protein
MSRYLPWPSDSGTAAGIELATRMTYNRLSIVRFTDSETSVLNGEYMPRTQPFDDYLDEYEEFGQSTPSNGIRLIK